MVRLEHVFAAGVRFDTEVQYLARNARGLRYQNLPILKSASGQACALNSVMQGVAVLGHIPRRQLAGSPGRVAQGMLAAAGHNIDTDSILRCIQAFDASIAAKVFQSADAHEIGAAALQALQSGGLCLLRFESATDTRWATVMGVEVAVHHDQAVPRALLLLDSQAGEPWACAHNVRIELQGRTDRSAGTSAGFPLTCRHLTGEASTVRLLSLMMLRRDVPTSPTAS